MNNLNINSYEQKLELLNTKLLEFVNVLYTIIKDDNIKIYKKKIKLALMYDNNIIYDLCEKYLLIYENDIINKNDKVLTNIEKNVLNNEIKLCEIWNNIDETNKIIIWKYLNVFLLLVK